MQQSVAMHTQVLHVSTDGAYSSIGKAVADAPEGATIRVASGMYVGTNVCWHFRNCGIYHVTGACNL